LSRAGLRLPACSCRLAPFPACQYVDRDSPHNDNNADNHFGGPLPPGRLLRHTGRTPLFAGEQPSTTFTCAHGSSTSSRGSKSIITLPRSTRLASTGVSRIVRMKALRASLKRTHAAPTTKLFLLRQGRHTIPIACRPAVQFNQFYPAGRPPRSSVCHVRSPPDKAYSLGV